MSEDSIRAKSQVVIAAMFISLIYAVTPPLLAQDARTERISRVESTEREGRASGRMRVSIDDEWEFDLTEMMLGLEGLEGLEGLAGLEGLQGLEGLEGLAGLEGLQGLESLEFSLHGLAESHSGLRNLDLELSGLDAGLNRLQERLQDLPYLGFSREDFVAHHEEELAQRHRLRELVNLDDEDALRELADMVRTEESPKLRRRLVGYIAEIESRQAIELLGEIALRDSDLRVRKEAIHYLGRSGDKRAIEILREILKN